MDPNTSLGRICMGEQQGVSFNDKVESEGHWDGFEFQDTTNSGEKKVAKAFTFYKMETEEVSYRYITPFLEINSSTSTMILESRKNIFGVRGPVKVRVERVTHPVMPEDIPEPAQEGAVEATYETLGDLVQRFHDHTQAIPVHRIQTIEGVQREQGHRIVGVESAVIALTERIAELERDNMRLRGTASVESQRVDRLQRGMSRMQRELRQMRRLRFYDRVRVGRLEACARKHMGYRS
ncbi:hypothetical protein Tco_1066227 [Tanacetum coccineum]|uniref:Uncharacterized protein n=1 Tax=Tanacetum coccineum TaxID=301880 RepID=A0ABQ5HB21_9ASTR